MSDQEIWQPAHHAPPKRPTTITDDLGPPPAIGVSDFLDPDRPRNGSASPATPSPPATPYGAPALLPLHDVKDLPPGRAAVTSLEASWPAELWTGVSPDSFSHRGAWPPDWKRPTRVRAWRCGRKRRRNL